MVIHAAVAVVVLVDVVDLEVMEDLVAAARVAAEDALVIAAGVMLALVAQGVAVVVMVDVVVVQGAEIPAVVVLDVLCRVKGAQDVLDVEVLAQAHVHQKVKDHHAQLAIVALAVLVHVRHARRVAVVPDLVVVMEVATGVMWDVKEAAMLLASVIVADVKEAANRIV